MASHHHGMRHASKGKAEHKPKESHHGLRSHPAQHVPKQVKAHHHRHVRVGYLRTHRVVRLEG